MTQSRIARHPDDVTGSIHPAVPGTRQGSSCAQHFHPRASCIRSDNNGSSCGCKALRNGWTSRICAELLRAFPSLLTRDANPAISTGRGERLRRSEERLPTRSLKTCLGSKVGSITSSHVRPHCIIILEAFPVNYFRR